ncbi:MAG: hypothetical protein NZ703_14795 [Gemmataceae bacterium]|nr:hypothetical protein [Gemmataceae bacterium]MCS7272349.1 hypothetical protein [Gemmataceae bacterium]MDW8242306.1 hypothetical protein [Thermogemmata sp.]
MDASIQQKIDEGTPVPEPVFPYLTVVATLLTLFLFASLMLLAYYSPYAPQADSETDADVLDPMTKMAEIRAKNQAILEGRQDAGTQMSLQAAMSELLSKLRTEKDTLPFPKPPPSLDNKDNNVQKK